MQTAHLVGIGAGEQNLLSFGQRQDVVLILQQHLRLLGGQQGLLGKLIRTELLVAFSASIRLVEQIQAILHAQDAAHGIVDALHADLALLHQFFKQDTELHAIGIHRHVDTGIDSNANGVFLVFCHMLARVQIINIGPVGHEHAVPLQVFLQPFRQVLVAGMYRHAVDGSRIDHHGQRAGQGSSLERFEVFLAQHLGRNVGRCAVFAAPGSAVCKIVLRAGAHVVGTQVVGIVALIAFDFGLHHARVDDGILAETLPDAAPSRITPQVNHGIIHPRAVSGAALVGRDFSTRAGQFRIERGGNVNRLGEERAALRVGHAVVMVQSVDVGDTDIFH